MNINFMVADDIKRYFGNRFQQHISNVIAQCVSQSGREVLDICTDTLSISELIAPNLAEIVSQSGFEISNFAISAMEIDVNDPNRQFLEKAYAKSREIEIMGSQYATIKDTDIRTNASQTPFAGMSFHKQDKTDAQSQLSEDVGSSQGDKDEYMNKLKQLHSMFQADLITQTEYDELKSRILEKMI